MHSCANRASGRRRHLAVTSLVAGLGLSLVACGLGTPGAARASEPVPASLAPSGAPQAAAKASFQAFARTWMQKMRKLERQRRAKPEIRRGGARPQVTYRGYGEEFETELRATEHPSTPFVGILRYTERLYSCSDTQARRCTIAATTPVTEIFRFQGDRWVY